MSTALYFCRRLSRQAEYMANKTYEEQREQLQDLYLNTQSRLFYKILDKYEQITTQRYMPTTNTLLLYQRYMDQFRDIQNILDESARREYNIDFTQLTNLYNEIATYNLAPYTPDTVKFGQFESDRAMQVVKTYWCSDGRHFSDRIWKNKVLLHDTLQQGIFECFTIGAPKSELVKRLIHVLNTSYAKADRIARTELTYVQNQAIRDRYIQSGITKYKFLASNDYKTSDICKKLNGQTFYLANARVGINYPPMHPNCRSTVLAVIE